MTTPDIVVSREVDMDPVALVLVRAVVGGIVVGMGVLWLVGGA